MRKERFRKVLWLVQNLTAAGRNKGQVPGSPLSSADNWRPNFDAVLRRSELFDGLRLFFQTILSVQLTEWITINCGKFWKRWEYQTTWPASWETYMQVRKQESERVMEQQTGSKQEKEYFKAVYCHPAYLTSMQSTSWETLVWKKHKLESRLPGLLFLK